MHTGSQLTPNPKLPQWYKKRGFTVNEKESMIVLDLVKPPADDSRYMPTKQVGHGCCNYH